MSKVEATIEDDTLVIRIKLKRDPHPSATGKSMVIASTDGPADTEATIDGKPIGIRLTAWTPRGKNKVRR